MWIFGRFFFSPFFIYLFQHLYVSIVNPEKGTKKKTQFFRFFFTFLLCVLMVIFFFFFSCETFLYMNTWQQYHENRWPKRGNNAVIKTTHKYCVDGRKKKPTAEEKWESAGERERERWSQTDDKTNDSILHHVIALVCSKQAVQLLTTMYVVRIINDCVLNFYVFPSFMLLMPVINARRCLMWNDVQLK